MHPDISQLKHQTRNIKLSLRLELSALVVKQQKKNPARAEAIFDTEMTRVQQVTQTDYSL